MDRYVEKEGEGVSVAKTESVSCSQAREMAREDAEVIYEEDLEFFDEDGYMLVGLEARSCDNKIVKSSCSCEATSNHLVCEYKGTFECTEAVWHKDQ